MADDQSFLWHLKNYASKRIAYVWGGADVERPEIGLDCSGLIYVAARKSGAICHRETALRMAEKRGGWNSIDLGVDARGLRDSQPSDIIWWTWREGNRKHGHVGVVCRDADGWPAVTHASQTRMRVVVEPIKGKLLSDISLIARPEIWGTK